jgi:hypothetical protein
MSFLASTSLIGILREPCIRGFEVGILSAQSEYPYIAPSRVEDPALPPGLVLALGNKVLISLNGFKHGSDKPCLQSIENGL